MSHYLAHLQPHFLVSQKALAASLKRAHEVPRKGRACLVEEAGKTKRVTRELNPEVYCLPNREVWARRTGLFWNLLVLMTGKLRLQK